MKLNTEQGTGPMAQALDAAAIVAGGDQQFGARDAGRVDHQRVVATHGQGAWESLEQAEPIVAELAGVPVDRPLAADHPRTEDLGQDLVPQAHPEHRDLCLGQNPGGELGLPGSPRSRSQDNPGGFEAEHLFHGQAFRRSHPDLCTQAGEGLGQIEGERIAMIDQQQHGGEVGLGAGFWIGAGQPG